MVKLKNYNFYNSGLSAPTASGFTIIGFSGVGKTQSVQRVLSLYPQIIMHTEYEGEEINHYQLVWLKLDCPYDGSVKGLCANFFLEFDQLFGDNTYKKYSSGRNATTDTMIPRMAQIARRHSLGLLVIDEIQHLSVAKSGGSEKMLNFFVNLVNTIGIPVILIGTTKARAILQGEFRQARRGSGQQGSMTWENMMKDEIWDLLIEGLWGYQWTKKQVPLSTELKNVLYEESQGIVDIAIKLYAMAQMRVIATGKEFITPSIIKQVAKDSLQLVRPMLQALKSGDERQIAKYDDIRPFDVREFHEENLRLLNFNASIKQKRDTERKKKEETHDLLEQGVLKLLELNVEPNMAKKVVQQAINQFGPKSEVSTIVKEALKIILMKELENKLKTRKNLEEKAKIKNRNDLRFIVEEGRKNKLSAYESLKLAGVIKNPLDDEFLKIR